MADEIRTKDQYNLALLRLMAELARAPTSEALREFESRLGHLIPPDQCERNPQGYLKWDYRVRWARQDLVGAGLMGSGGRGIWTITEAGLQWLEENPNASRLDLPKGTGSGKGAPVAKRRSSGRGSHSTKPASARAITLQMLEQTRVAMPASEFRQLWGSLYDQLVAEDRAKATTPISQTELGMRAKREIDKIHSYLHGRHTEKPDAKRMCAWIEFCYTLELHREAASLLQYLDENEVEAAVYGQVKRLATASKAKLGW